MACFIRVSEDENLLDDIGSTLVVMVDKLQIRNAYRYTEHKKRKRLGYIAWEERGLKEVA